ncbi:hypothetical protein K469DRAFT_680019 [Zopfia rhizophila CBS 207.26]|uniref:Aminoglycoside phosphotransferase domain-containing protein n=1 Tax=Zopfia rhizophila CBS 207.26 TaxID=1314779 RepID=A0A6A6DD14_9PEZI|nr:hypothetical protein K469DRAFT_680019 [Zopfia rhizophila CBS 207.26]
MFCELDPPIGQSVYGVRPYTWKIGATVICEKVSKVPENALTHWRDDDMNIFCLRPAEPTQAETEEITPIYSSGTSGAVWSIGGIFCKVKSWQRGIEQEKEAIDFVKKRFKDVPLPKVLYAWTEPEYSRSYLILQQMPGIPLERAWSSLSTVQRRKIATQIAGYCDTLATARSDALQTATGCGITDGLLMTPSRKDEPSWKRRTLTPLDLASAEDYLSPLYLGNAFYYYHADLCPSNILVLDGKVSGILDWEHAAFYPRFWIATKPHFSYGFALEGEDTWAWTKLLSQALTERGFIENISGFQHWREKSRNAKLA